MIAYVLAGNAIDFPGSRNSVKINNINNHTHTLRNHEQLTL